MKSLHMKIKIPPLLERFPADHAGAEEARVLSQTLLRILVILANDFDGVAPHVLRCGARGGV